MVHPHWMDKTMHSRTGSNEFEVETKVLRDLKLPECGKPNTVLKFLNSDGV
jgi:hypothetical protein